MRRVARMAGICVSLWRQESILNDVAVRLVPDLLLDPIGHRIKRILCRGAEPVAAIEQQSTQQPHACAGVPSVAVPGWRGDRPDPTAAFVWRSPRASTVWAWARPFGESALRFATYEQFLR